MNTYHVVIDSDMLRNTMQTDVNESLDLLSIKLFLYVVFLGLLPSFLVYKAPIEDTSFKTEFFRKIKTILLTLLIMIIILFSFSKFYTSFFREHKPLRYYTNPTYWIYSIGDYMAKTVNHGKVIVKPIGRDAKVIASNEKNNHQKTNLVIMVVGEAARADHFSLNGYKKETNPLLKQEDIISFQNMYACGTSTAHSVPCMFSIFNRKNIATKKALAMRIF